MAEQRKMRRQTIVSTSAKIPVEQWFENSISTLISYRCGRYLVHLLALLRLN